LASVDLGHLLKTRCEKLLLQGGGIVILSNRQMEDRRFQVERRRGWMRKSVSGSKNDWRFGVIAWFSELLKCGEALSVGLRIEDLGVNNP